MRGKASPYPVLLCTPEINPDLIRPFTSFITIRSYDDDGCQRNLRSDLISRYSSEATFQAFLEENG
ncbi:MAG: hypothetical protein ACLT8E_09145 [Akkermansia sp.]